MGHSRAGARFRHGPELGERRIEFRAQGNLTLLDGSCRRQRRRNRRAVDPEP